MSSDEMCRTTHVWTNRTYMGRTLAWQFQNLCVSLLFFSIPQPVLMCVSGYCFDAGIVVSKFKVVLEITEVVCLLRYSSRSVKRSSALK